MLFQNKFYIGVIFAILVSCLAFFVLTLLNEELYGHEVFGRTYYGVRDQFVMILSVVSNLIPFNLYNRRRLFNAMRGVGLVTLLEGTGTVIYMFA